jgi:hypothetical protein
MSSQPRTAREEERRVNIRTLAIASIASAAAAVITSQFWLQGTWMAAAVTPVIVALISEMLHKPTDVIAERVTSRGTSILPATRGPAEPSGPAGSRGRAEYSREEEPAPAEPGTRGEPAAPPVRVYKAGADKPLRPRASRRKIAVGVVALTALLAFAIAAAAVTGTELLTGGSIGKGRGDTTLFSGDSKKPEEREQQEDSQPEGTPAPNQPESGGGEEDQTQPQPEQPSEEPPAEEPSPVPETPEPQAPQQQP